METKKEVQDKKLEEFKKNYTVRGFKTTSESFKFMKKISGAISALENIEDLKDEDMFQMFNVFDEKIIKFVVGGYLLKKDGDKRKAIDYEKEFVGDIEGLMVAFSFCTQFLMEKMNGGGKQEAQTSQEMKVKSKKR